jgi:hypothetical protein
VSAAASFAREPRTQVLNQYLYYFEHGNPEVLDKHISG